MSRHTRSRSAKFLTLAGLTFLSGCTGGSTNPTTVTVSETGPTRTTSGATSSSGPRSLAAKHTIDGCVSPVWYQFDDPPMPALLPADGPAPDAADSSPEGTGDNQPTVVLPTDNADSVRRLPPTDGDSDAEPVSDRYGVDSRYDLSAPQQDGSEDARRFPGDYSPERAAEPSPHDTLDTPARQYEPPRTSPLIEPPLASPDGETPRSNERVERLPPLEEQATEQATGRATEHGVAPPTADLTPPVAADSTTYGRRYAEDALAPPPDLSRPSEALADEARPVGRFERLPPIDDTPAASAPVVVTPRGNDSIISDSAASPLPNDTPATPFVLPPVESGSERSPIVAVTPPRHREMELINQRAGEAVRQGYELAHRGALYSAQTEFASALRTIAQALDAQGTDTKHVQSLVAGLTALEESDDFLVPARSVTATIDVAAVVAKHRTPVLKDAAKEDLTPIIALQRYYTFAQEQLAAAVEHEPAASQALYGMGKVQTTLQASRTGSLADGPKAIALHQAALLVDDRNFMAANELGVLLARCGRYDAARAALAHSVSISPQPAVWRNLAAVHDQLGETTLAANARAASQNAPRTAANTASGGPALQQPVVWLDPAAFAQSAQPQSDLQRGQPAAAPTPAPTTVPHTSEKKSGMKWPLW